MLDRRVGLLVATLAIVASACTGGGTATTAPQSPLAQPVTIDPPARDEAEPSDAPPARARTVETAPPLSILSRAAPAP